jgi:hypothetical protein
MPVAISCILVFCAIVGFVGVIDMVTRLAEEPAPWAEDETLPPPPHPSKIINNRDTSKIESRLHLFNMLFSSSANSAKIL